jgi:hypothetical protein
MGIGDIINYGGARAFITGKTSTSVWSVSTATGTVPVATTSAPVTSITHAFSSLNAALGYGANNATSTNFLATSSLTMLDYVLHIPLYYDTGPDANPVDIRSWTTSATNYIRIYTPTSTASEVNQSQRHTGKWDTSKHYFEGSASFAYFVQVRSPNVRFDGIQMRNTHSSASGNINFNLASTTTAGDFYVSNSVLLRGTLTRGTGINFPSLTQTSNSRNIYIWNNVFSGPVQAVTISSNFSGTFRIYNNTVIDASTAGLQGEASFGVPNQVVYLKNNLIANTTNPMVIGTRAGSGSNYNATASTSLGYVIDGSGGSNDRVSQTFSFVDTNVFDLHLVGSDTGALDAGVDLSAEPGLSFNTDIDGEVRPYNSLWDIGADEFYNNDTTPPNLSAGAPSGSVATGTTSTNLTLTTNESSTCKYATTTNVAYASMVNTFSTTGGTSHSTSISGLSNGNKYRYYARCSDGGGNVTTSDYEITFRVGSSGTTYAESCSRTHVNEAISASMTGDIVSIPAGTCTGISSSINVNKAITLQGAGIDQTIFEMASTTDPYNTSLMYVTARATVKDMTIRTENQGDSPMAFSLAANGFRITNIKYIGQGTGGYFAYAGNVYGLIDNVDVTGCCGSNELIFTRGTTDSWQTNSSMGSSTAVFIENSIFRGSGYVTDCNSNARCVVRNTAVTGQMKVDGHGIASNSPARGVRHMEVYNNTWTAAEASWTAMELRGGTGRVFNNTSTGGSLRLHEYCATAVWGNCGGVQLDVDDYPIADQIGVGKDPKSATSEPYYLWNNLKLGNPWSITLGYGNAAELGPIIMANRDYYTATTSFTGADGVGTGILSARPASCTTGVGYWATDQGGSWNAVNGTSTDGALYTCASTNTWKKTYIPYAFPHYLTAASTTGTDLVDRGGGARFFGTGKFYAMSTSTVSSTYANLSITPSDTSPDTWVDVWVSLWSNTGTRHKVWTESSENATTTTHVVGDLSPSTEYVVKVDNVIGDGISGGSCLDGICTSDGSGKITFTYFGGYSNHEFDVEQYISGDTTAPIISSIASSTTATTATITWTTDESATSTVNYGASTSYGTASSSSSFTTSHSITLTGLTAGTLYHFQVASGDSSYNYATSSDGTFTTLTISAPSLTTSSASSLTQTTATLNGSVTSTGGADVTTRGFAYSTSTTLTTNVSTSTESGTFGTGAYSYAVSSLTCNTTYYARAYGTNTSGTGYGSIVSFTTSACAPTVTTQSATSVTESSATLNGTITVTGGANASIRGFVYGLTTSYGATTTESGSFGTGAYTGAISSLTCNTLYHVKVYATNTGGTSYGSDTTFTTSACSAPTITTSSASSLTQTTATLNGTITATGGSDATESGFAYGTSTDLSVVIATSTLGAQTGTSAFSSAVSSLTCNATYYVRAYATNVAGTGYGSIVSFTTSACASEEVAQTSASSSGNRSRRDTGGGSAAVINSIQNPVTTPTTIPTYAGLVDLFIEAGIVPAEKVEEVREALIRVSASVYSPYVRHLQLHDIGEDVSRLQSFLIEQGLLSATPNGVFGIQTYLAVKAYQERNSLPPTGYFGPLTKAWVGGAEAAL